MDGSQFDAMLRRLSPARSRRSALVGILGGGLGLLRASQAEARRHKKHKKHKGKTSPPALTCPTGYSACGEQCVDLTDNTSNCGACAVVCSPGKPCCNGVCADLQSDEANCGACGTVCAAGQTCCSGVCRTTQTDRDNCGTCGTVCDSSNPFNTCRAGRCCLSLNGSCTLNEQCCSGFCDGIACL